MKTIGIDERLRKRIEEIYEDTTCGVELGEREVCRMRLEKGIRQGCPLSPTLFNIDFADLEEEI